MCVEQVSPEGAKRLQKLRELKFQEFEYGGCGGTIAKTYGTGSRRWLRESSSMELAPYHNKLQ